MTEDEKLGFSGIIVGDAVTEKTSLREQLGEIENLGITHTGPFELINNEIEIKKKKIQISLWTIDTSSDNWKTIRGTYYKHASGAIIVFDSAEEYWIDNLKFWVKEIKRENSKITTVFVHDLINKEKNDSKQIEEIIANKVFKRYKYKFSVVELKEITNEKIKEIYTALSKKLFKKLEKT